MTKVIKSIPVSKQTILKSLTVPNVEPDDQIREPMADLIANLLLENGEFRGIDGSTYVSLDSVGKFMYSLLRKNASQVSDGSHTFQELYDHRSMIFLLLMEAVASNGAQAYDIGEIWWSKKHADSTMFNGYIVVGMETKFGQCTYHVKYDPYGKILEHILKDSSIEYRELAPEWDGHNSKDVLCRLTQAFLGSEALSILHYSNN